MWGFSAALERWDPAHKENFSNGVTSSPVGAEDRKKDMGWCGRKGSQSHQNEVWAGKCLPGTTIMDKYPKSSAGAEHSEVLNAQSIRNKPEVLRDLCEVAWLQFCWDDGDVGGWLLDEVLPWRDEGSFRKGRVGK